MAEAFTYEWDVLPQVIAEVRRRFEAQQREVQALKEQLRTSVGELDQMYAGIRQVAGDLRALAADSLITAQAPERLQLLDQLATGRELPGIPVTELTADQKEELQKVLQSLLEPFRTEDQSEVRQCLKKQGGLDKCSLVFYTDGDIGDDGVWDNWRLEGPSFVWHFRGTPHIHVWVNVADDPSGPYRPKG
mgnify:CR=1 FL=1